MAVNENASFTWPDILTRLVHGQDLDFAATSWAMEQILSGLALPVQIAGFAVALRAKGETVEEISGLADVMRESATPISLDTNAVDIVGSGGDRANTVNISTMAAIVAAGAGAKVIKHGNRAASSMSGTADCLEALGLPLDLSPEKQAQVLDECRIVFLFAALYHQSLRFSSGPRRELGIQTTFNFLGPLTNPARPQAQAIGVADKYMADLMAGVLARRGARGLVFHGEDGLDELTTSTKSDVWIIKDGQIKQTELDPGKLGIPASSVDDFRGGKPADNAQVVWDIVNGKTGPVRDIVLLNAAAAILAFDGPNLDLPLEDQFASGLERAADSIDSGKAATTLNHWLSYTQQLTQ